MEIHLNEYKEVLDYLVKSRWSGMEYVAYNRGNGPSGKESLLTFSDEKEAREFCRQMSKDLDLYEFLSIRSVYRCMSEALRDQSLLIEKDGIVGISDMVNQYYVRLSNEGFNNNQNLETTKPKEDVMEKKNVEYLENQMFYSGFGEIPKDQLHERIREGKEEFQLVHDTSYGTDKVRALLNFKMSDQNPGTYFFNSFDLLLKKEDREETMQQNFRTYYGNSFTLKEGYNLLDGRSVNKNFVKVDKEDKANNEEYNAWAYLDFKETDKYGNFVVNKLFNYELEKKIDEYPIKNLEYPNNRSQLIDSLKKGNRPMVTLETSRGDEKVYLEAAPRYNSLNLYDSDMKPIRLSLKKEGMGNEVAESQSQKKTTQSDKQEEKTGQSQDDQSEKQSSGQRKGDKQQSEKTLKQPVKKAARRSRGVA